MGMADAKSGFLEIVSDWNEPAAATEFGMLRRVVEASSRTAVFSLTQRRDRTETWKELLGLAGDAARAGLSIRPVVAPRPRSAERRVGKWCVRRCRSRWSRYPLQKNNHPQSTTAKYI